MKNAYTLYPLNTPLRISSLCTAFIEEQGSEFSYAGESHDFYEAVFILRGEAGIVAGDEILTLKAGHMIVHPPMEFHRIWNSADRELRFLVFTFGASAFPEVGHRIAAFTQSEGEEMCAQVHTLINSFDMDRKMLISPKKGAFRAPIFIAVGRIENLLLALLSSSSVPTPDGSRSARRYSEAVAIMQENLSRRLTVEEIAELCHMSRSALQKLFYRYAGMGIMNYYTRMKVARAVELLQNGTPVKETAAALGFLDQNYFSRLFRRCTGNPPSAYRKSEK